MHIEIGRNTGFHSQSPGKGGLYRKYFKRLMDFVLSLIAIIVLSPVMFIIAVLVKINLGVQLFSSKKDLV